MLRLEHALAFERMAAQENNPEVKAQFEKQARRSIGNSLLTAPKDADFHPQAFNAKKNDKGCFQLEQRASFPHPRGENIFSGLGQPA